MVNNLCKEHERSEALRVLQTQKNAVEKVKGMILHLSNDERDKLNAWNNLNDTVAEENFYTNKMKQLPPPDYKMIKSAYSRILEKMFSATLPEHYNEIFSHLSEKDFDQLRLLAKEDQKDAIREFVMQKASKQGLKEEEVNDLFYYFTNSFKLVTLKEGSGTRQYQYRPHDDDQIFWETKL
ncbi:unnamed protein product [Bursaphelenchus xylophilus]|uniref:(pine wood nematode) hypothetical protein n=1 Tax=Bursaphelenchus xylophilus TaxID=6326 RepID=A0A1I7STN4_BURXY|nr:unnamed protein product [Bursaphelenchus xylophilus]CAG9108180.1 unnamed protein product [Bursaphelenchus xylophilus]